jgi:hypothetical protein
VTTPSSKLQGERRKITFDFRNDLDFGEGISSSFVYVAVSSGIDSDPDVILFDTSTIVGKTVEQVVVLGSGGVIYTVVCEITTSLGRSYQFTQPLAVLTSPSLTPPLVGTRFSSRPYPLSVIDGVDWTTQVLSGELRQLIQLYEFSEAIDYSTGVVSGELRDVIQILVVTPDGIDLQTLVVSGELRPNPIYTYDEAINHSMQIQTGELKDNVVYSNWPAEGIDHSTLMVSGILA